MKKIIFAGIASTILFTSSVFAHEDHNASFSNDHCAVDFNYGVVVEGQNIRFIDNDNTLVQINDLSQLFVHGKEVSLNQAQQALVSDYASGIKQQVPEIVELALDAVEIAFGAVTQVMVGLGVEDSSSADRIDQLFVSIKEKVHKRFNKDNGNYFLAEQNFNEFDEFMEEELEAEIESIVADSVGNILIAVGQAMNDEEGNFEQKMQAFGQRMERMGENIEAAVEPQAEALGAKAEALCDSLKELDYVEQELSNSIDELAKFNLITLKN
ncbi:DUF2884 family protein [Thalassotalea aquiviva]|uniref:DUF2884 family protein n=1 Tax=Thalassotalea aquiviva TaxID=3242415 RepID=UPI00352BA5CA